jgi:AraC-like DNA-binding protein
MDGPVFMRTLYVGGDVTPFAPARCTVVDVPSLLRELIVSLASEADPPDPGLCARRHALETLALVELASLTALPFHVPLPKDPRLSRLCRWLLDHPDDGRTFDELARQAGASARTLRRIFREEIGMGFATWRQQARLIDGMARLAEGRSVSQVAEELGYATPSAFTAMFKRMMGLPPTSIADDRTHDRRQTQDQDPAVARAPHDGRRITPDRPRTGRTPNRRRASAGYGRS